MAKKVFAVTNVKGNDVWVDAGEPMDKSVLDTFTKDQLKELLDSGAIEVREVEEVKEPGQGPDTSVTNPEEEEKPETE